jgi:enoyl-CoA hydratase
MTASHSERQVAAAATASDDANAAPQSEPHAVISERDGVITVTLNRPEKLNPISPEVTAVLWEATLALGERDDLRVMVITGVGRFMSSGLDLKLGHGTRLPGRDAPGFGWRRGYRSHHLLYDEMEAIEKPIILAANGPCMGAAMEMALSCDFRFCTPETTWALPEVRLGSVPGSGGASRLTRLVGSHWSKWIAMAGQEVDATDARMMGLVHRIVPAPALMEQVDEFASSLMDLDAETTGMIKLVIDMCDPQDREKARQVERLANTDLVHRGAGQRAAGHRMPSAASERP